MISQQRAKKKRIDNLVNAAEKLAAVQFEFGLRSAENKPDKREKCQKKAIKCWNEFRLACDEVMREYIEQPVMLVRWPR